MHAAVHDAVHDAVHGARDVEDTADAVASADAHGDTDLDALRTILVGQDRQKIAELKTRVADLELRIQDRSALIAVLLPVIGDAIRRKIQDSREEMVEALYPIIGQLVVRAVAEAIRDLARNIDTRMQTSLSPQVIGRRLWARLRGVSNAEMALREALPFSVREIFLIHRATGLLLLDLSSDPEASSDSDLISGMLTAIRDFVQDTFGRGRAGELDEIQYGDQRILIEAARHVYLAVVVDGVEPPGFRAEMRERLIDIQNGYTAVLQDYDGDASRLAQAAGPLRALMMAQPAPPESGPGQRRIMIGLAGLLALCVLAACVGEAWLVWQGFAPPPAAVVAGPTEFVTVVVTETATPWVAPTSTPRPTPTATPRPTATVPPRPTTTPSPWPTATATVAPMPTMPAQGRVAVPRLNVRAGPGLGYPILMVTTAGTVYDLVRQDAAGDWWQVCCLSDSRFGWVSAQFLTVGAAVETAPVIEMPAQPGG